MAVQKKQKWQTPVARQAGRNVMVSGINCLDLSLTLDCGQAFRWQRLEDGRWRGVAGGYPLMVGIEEQAAGASTLILYDTSLAAYEGFWRNYFDMDRDYGIILQAMEGHPVLAQAAAAARGIRLLRQEPWEALCSFIISQNNNIPRIKGIIARLCRSFGKPIAAPDGWADYTFPSPADLADQTPATLAPLRAGFRTTYILDAAKKVAEGQVRLDDLAALPLEEARARLMQIKGVGPKVADCALLFGAGHLDAFPADVWIKRAMKTLFDGTLPACAAPYAGIVQQYIFHYARTTRLQVEEP